MIAWILIAVVLVLIGATTAQLARTHRSAEGAGVRDRGEVLTVLSTDVTLLVLARALVDWNVVPWALWLVGLALTAGAVVLAGLTWDNLPWIRSTRRPLRIASIALQLAVAVGATAVLI